MHAKTKIPRPSWFVRRLKGYLRRRHPDLVQDRELIRTRSQQAWSAAWQVRQSGCNVSEAMQRGEVVLFRGLHFSKYDTICCILSAEFDEVSESKRSLYAKRLLPHCEVVFVNYSLTDQLLESPAYNHLITDLIEVIRCHIG